MADSERDTASCSGGDEDSRSGLHSPSASEDSVEVQVTPISLRNKRKLAEPRKIQEPSTAPLKKRRFHHIEETVVVMDEESRSISTPSPFRPWIIPRTSSDASKTSTATTSTVTTMSGETTTTTTTTATSSVSLTAASSTASTLSKTTSEGMIDDQPRAVVDGETHEDQDETMQRLQESLCRIQQATSHNRSVVLSRREPRHKLEEPSPVASAPASSLPQLRLQEEPLSLVMRDEAPRVPSHPAVSGTYEKTPSYMMEHLLASSSASRSHRNHRSHTSLQQQAQQSHQTVAVSSSSSSSSSHVRHHQGVTGGGGGGGGGGGSSGQQRNYKNMTRERRIEANARERTRVHTISAAFDTLRRAIPAYSHNQKLSKLSVLRIACSYIVTLTKIRKMLEGEAPSGASLADCVEQVSRTIQTEGKLRKRKDE